METPNKTEVDFDDMSDEELENAVAEMQISSDKDAANLDAEDNGAYHMSNIDGVLHIWLLKGIDSPHKYTKLFHYLETKTDEMDEIVLHISSVGGDVDTGIQLMNALKATGLPTTSIVVGAAQSMAAMIAVATDRLIMNPHTYIMFHDYAYSYSGKAGVQDSLAKVLARVYKRLDKDYLTGILTPKEFTRMYDGADIYLTDEEMTNRLIKLRGNNE